MQAIMYGGDEFVTGDAIADALLAYGRALGDDVRAEIIAIPVREEDGSVVTAKFLIGPASQIVAKTVRDRGPELEDEELVSRLNDLTRSVEAPTGGSLEMSGDATYEVD
ncbi:hypothetical protein [Microbacterium sp. PMB16]|uniref:hypothetical protein n=1 Tax=Microbacterium sp. PMB16 TaxID=3120157 RepID=UPI003F4CA77C